MEDYPRRLADFERRFTTEEACRRYLADLRWPDGYRPQEYSGAIPAPTLFLSSFGWHILGSIKNWLLALVFIANIML